MATERIDSTDGKITVFYRFTPWAWASLAWSIEVWHKDHDLICDQMIMGDSLGDSLAMALASVYPQESYETIVAYVEDNLNTPVITADDDDD